MSDFNEIGRLFDVARQLSARQREVYLEREARERPELAEHVLALLEHDQRAEEACFLTIPNEGVASHAPVARDPADPYLGRQLGPYLIESRLAAGGMGVVYRGTRVEGFHQHVAIKVLRSNVLAEDSLRRFELERRAMAKLSHPSIAPLIDAGQTSEGVPYLVMPLIDGERIDEYCRNHRLSYRKKVALALTMCRAVQFAHDNGVLHRDLKPGNVLVTRDSMPIITDFGLAKLLQPTGDTTTATQAGTIIGTPSFVPPEQLGDERVPITIRSDVYGLGAVLFTLLADRPPFSGDNIAKTLHDVRYAAPPKLRTLAPRVSRDLEVTCAKCLAKQPAARYASATELAEDLQRILENKPVRARPMGSLESIYRWLIRNPVAGASLSLVMVLVVSSLIALSYLLAVAEQHRSAAERQRARMRQVVDDMYTGIAKTLEDVPGTSSIRRDVLVSALVAYRQLASELSDKPAVLRETATAYYRVGMIERRLGNLTASRQAGRQALQIFSQLAQDTPADHRLRFDMFHCHLLLANMNEAHTLITQLAKEHPEMDYLDAVASISQSAARNRASQGDVAAALQIADEGFRIAKELTETHPEVRRLPKNMWTNMSVKSHILLGTRQFGESYACALEAIRLSDLHSAHFEKDATFVIERVEYQVAASNGAVRLGMTGAAVAHGNRALAISQQGIERDPDVLSCWHARMICQRQMAFLHCFVGNDEAASSAYDQLETTMVAFHKKWHRSTVNREYAWFLTHHPDSNRRDPQRAQEIIRPLIDHSSPSTSLFECLAWIEVRRGEYARALDLIRRVAQGPTPVHWSLPLCHAMVLARTGDPEGARAILDAHPADPTRNNLDYVVQHAQLHAEILSELDRTPTNSAAPQPR